MDYRFEGIPVYQHPNIQLYFPLLVPNFDRIIELGTFTGGLSLYIHRIKREDTDFITYDFNMLNYLVPEEQCKIDRRFGDFYNKATQQEIVNLIMDISKRVLLLCDGGDKNYEINTFCKYLKPGDVIMGHDYAETDEEWHLFADPIGWTTSYEPFGCSYEKIKSNIDKGYISKHGMYNEFKSVLWGAFIRK